MQHLAKGKMSEPVNYKKLVAELAVHFYNQGWFPGSGGSLTIRDGETSKNLANAFQTPASPFQADASTLPLPEFRKRGSTGTTCSCAPSTEAFSKGRLPRRDSSSRSARRSSWKLTGVKRHFFMIGIEAGPGPKGWAPFQVTYLCGSKRLLTRQSRETRSPLFLLPSRVAS